MDTNRKQEVKSVKKGREGNSEVKIGIKEPPSARHRRFKLTAVEQKYFDGFSQEYKYINRGIDCQVLESSPLDKNPNLEKLFYWLCLQEEDV